MCKYPTFWVVEPYNYGTSSIDLFSTLLWFFKSLFLTHRQFTCSVSAGFQEWLPGNVHQKNKHEIVISPHLISCEDLPSSTFLLQHKASKLYYSPFISNNAFNVRRQISQINITSSTPRIPYLYHFLKLDLAANPPSIFFEVYQIHIANDLVVWLKDLRIHKFDFILSTLTSYNPSSY